VELASVSVWNVRGTLDYGCRYKAGGTARRVGFCHNDHSGDTDVRKSTTGPEQGRPWHSKAPVQDKKKGPHTVAIEMIFDI
jgi:hypothetical protein